MENMKHGIMDKEKRTMSLNDVDEMYMRRCLQLAAMGRGHVSPNPMVGAVVVWNRRIIGEGYHRCCGQAHAEVNAIASVKCPERLKESTIYVSLEPCSHYGKTPPCSRLIIEKQIPRVVVGCMDPFPSVSGRGIAALRDAGIEVVTGVLEAECRALNRSFMAAQLLQRPYIVLKWAQSRDGFIDYERSEAEPPAMISSRESLTWVHRLRAEADAILVGTETVLKDNPSLTARYWYGKNPLRVTIDRHGRIPQSAALLDGSAPTLVFDRGGRHDVLRNQVEYVALPDGSDELGFILAELHRRKIRRLIVEGGAALLQSFIDAGYWDEARVETGESDFCSGVSAPHFEGDCFARERQMRSTVAWYRNNR